MDSKTNRALIYFCFLLTIYVCTYVKISIWIVLLFLAIAIICETTETYYEKKKALTSKIADGNLKKAPLGPPTPRDDSPTKEEIDKQQEEYKPKIMYVTGHLADYGILDSILNVLITRSGRIVHITEDELTDIEGELYIERDPTGKYILMVKKK